MGTNYYERLNICDCCNRYDERHIGKSSFGWQFFFQGFKDWQTGQLTFTSWQEWKSHLKNARIFDEYGQEIAYEDFVAMVESTKGRRRQSHRDWEDDEGWSFDLSDFS